MVSAPQAIYDQISGSSRSYLRRRLDTYVPSCVMSSSSLALLNRRKMMLLKVFLEANRSISEREKAVQAFRESFIARVKLYDPHQKHRLADLMRVYLSKEYAQLQISSEVQEKVLEELGVSSWKMPAVFTAALVSSALLAYVYFDEPKRSTAQPGVLTRFRERLSNGTLSRPRTYEIHPEKHPASIDAIVALASFGLIFDPLKLLAKVIRMIFEPRLGIHYATFGGITCVSGFCSSEKGDEMFPAERAGLQVMDRILSVNNQKVEGDNLSLLVSMLTPFCPATVNVQRREGTLSIVIPCVAGQLRWLPYEHQHTWRPYEKAV